MGDFLNTEEAAELLGLTARRVRALIVSGRLPAKTLGSGARPIYLIDAADIKRFRPRKAGRPKGSKKKNGDR